MKSGVSEALEALLANGLRREVASRSLRCSSLMRAFGVGPVGLAGRRVRGLKILMCRRALGRVLLFAC